MKGDSGVTCWSWVDKAHSSRGVAGGHKRPWSVRERLVTEAVGDEVRRLRENAGVTTHQLAARLCISQPHVSYLETGRRAVWLPLLWDLAEVLKVPPGHFVEVAQKAVERFETRRRPGARSQADN
jgi:ribosome-binding protein aMBF1 (putative translation factor)